LRRFVRLSITHYLSVLSGLQKKCQEDTMAKDTEDIIAIVHDDDLQLFEDMVRTS
jgi:hypothetical protein